MALWEPRREFIVAKYVMGDWSHQQLADHYGVTPSAMQRVLKRLTVAPKSRGRRGHQNGRFKDGSQSTLYRGMVQKTHCNCCGETRWLVVHHIDGVHTNNTPKNLEVLCSPCHSRHHKQEWWNSQKAARAET